MWLLLEYINYLERNQFFSCDLWLPILKLACHFTGRDKKQSVSCASGIFQTWQSQSFVLDYKTNLWSQIRTNKLNLQEAVKLSSSLIFSEFTGRKLKVSTSHWLHCYWKLLWYYWVLLQHGRLKIQLEGLMLFKEKLLFVNLDSIIINGNIYSNSYKVIHYLMFQQEKNRINLLRPELFHAMHF